MSSMGDQVPYSEYDLDLDLDHLNAMPYSNEEETIPTRIETDQYRPSIYNTGQSTQSLEHVGSSNNIDTPETRLYYLCDMVSSFPRTSIVDISNKSLFANEEAFADSASQTWQTIREWLRDTDDDTCVRAVQYTGDFDSTALHLAVKAFHPPFDVIEKLIDCNLLMVSQADAFSWLPIHYACANGSSVDVMMLLAKAYPDGLLQQDKRGRTPLHFALGRTPSSFRSVARDVADSEEEGERMSEIVRLLCSSGAAELSDTNGMLPIHYACAYGTHQLVLRIMYDAFPASIDAVDNNNRTPLHFVMSNAGLRSVSPGVVIVGLLIELDENYQMENFPDEKKIRLVDKFDRNDQSPLHLLSTQAKKLQEAQKGQRANVTECMNVYLDANPKGRAKFMMALLGLPDWLRDSAVLHPYVQKLLNKEVAKRFPTFFLILDMIMLMIILVFFSFITKIAMNDVAREECVNPDCVQPPIECDYPHVPSLTVFFLYLGVVYFSLREAVQILSYIQMGTFRSWYCDFTNYLDLAVIILVGIYTYAISNSVCVYIRLTCSQQQWFEVGLGLAFLTIYVDVIFVFKFLSVDFAVFISGVLYVVSHLVTFMFTLILFLFAFAQMFNLTFVFTEQCMERNIPPTSPSCEPTPVQDDMFLHCTFRHSLLRVYSMMMGEVEVTDILGNHIAEILYVLYGLVIIIILSNMLIALVTSAYQVIREQRAAIVFWNNRLEFITEMYAIQKTLVGAYRYCLRTDREPTTEVFDDEHDERTAYFESTWATFMDYFDDLDPNKSQFEYICTQISRLFIGLIMVIWIILGIPSCGLLWPPQVRNAVGRSKLMVNASGEYTTQISVQLGVLRSEMKELREEMEQFKKSENIKVAEIKEKVIKVKDDIMQDAMQVKELMRTLLDLRRSGINNS